MVPAARSAGGSGATEALPAEALPTEALPTEAQVTEDQLTRTLPLPWWAWTLPRPLERRFAAQWAAQQAPWFLPITVIGTLAFLALTAPREAVPSGTAATLAELRWTIVGFTVVYLSARALSHRRGWAVPPLVWSLCYAIGSTSMSVYSVILSRAAPTDLDAVRSSAVLLTFLSTALVARLPLTLCALCGVTSVGVYAALVYPMRGASQLVVQSNVLLFLTSFSFTIAVRWALDRSQRAAWVLHELDVLRRADLVAGSEALRRLGLHDPLTGLGNRRKLDATLADPDLARQPLLLLALDIDDFKAYNDTYGHLGGDACLRTVAAALDGVATRLSGVASRVGGEEFTLVVPDAGPGAGADAAAAVCDAVRELHLPHASSRCRDIVTVSVGVAVLDADRGGARELKVREALLAADQALYDAKAAGRDRWAEATTSRREPTASRANAHRESTDPSGCQGARSPRATRRRPRLAPEAVKDFWEQSPALRQRRMTALVLAFSPIVVLITAADGRLIADVATQVVTAAAAIQVVIVVAFTLAMRWHLTWQWRVRSLAVVVLCLAGLFLWGAHASTAPLALVTLLSLVLLPMFLAFVVAVPLRTVAIVCGLLFLGLVAVTHAWAVPQTSIAANVVKTDLFAGLYALLGTYLLQQSRYLEFSLTLRERDLREALKAQRVELEVLATRDPLTGLTNRRAFEQHLAAAQQAAAPVGAPVALLLLDVDHFKRYNDTAGHPAGDEVLRRIGRALDAWAVGVSDDLPTWTGSPTALASRWGGEEFGILLPGVAVPQARVLAEQVRAVIAELALPHPCSPVAERVTVSIGVAAASITGDGAAPETIRTTLLTEADEALYRAKAGGRDRVG